MFRQEDTVKNFARICLQGLEKDSNPYYTRAGFAAFIKAVQRNIDSDWPQVLRSIITDGGEGSMISVRMNYMQDLCLSFCLYDIYTADVLRGPPELVGPLRNERRLRHWSTLRPLICLSIQVPRKRLGFLTAIPFERRGAPSFCLTLESIPGRWSNTFGAVHVGYGRIISARDEICCLVEEDHSGIHGGSDLVLSAFVATWVLFQQGGDFVVGAGIQSTPLNARPYVPPTRSGHANV